MEQTLLLPSDKEVMYLPSNGATVNVVHHDTDLYFQVHEFLIVNISIYVDISMNLATAIDSRNGCAGTIPVYLSQKILLPFHNFQVMVKTPIVSFQAHCSTNSRFFGEL